MDTLAAESQMYTHRSQVSRSKPILRRPIPQLMTHRTRERTQTQNSPRTQQAEPIRYDYPESHEAEPLPDRRYASANKDQQQDYQHKRNAAATNTDRADPPTKQQSTDSLQLNGIDNVPETPRKCSDNPT